MELTQKEIAILKANIALQLAQDNMNKTNKIISDEIRNKYDALKIEVNNKHKNDFEAKKNSLRTALNNLKEAINS